MPRAEKNFEKRRTPVHLLNGTLCAAQRTLCCVLGAPRTLLNHSQTDERCVFLENYQTPTGVRVPPPLVPFLMGPKTSFFPFLHPAPPAPSATPVNKNPDALKQNLKPNPFAPGVGVPPRAFSRAFSSRATMSEMNHEQFQNRMCEKTKSWSEQGVRLSSTTPTTLRKAVRALLMVL